MSGRWMTTLALAFAVALPAAAVGQTTTERAGDKAERAADKAADKMERAGDKAANKAERAGDKVERASDKAADKAERAGDKTADKSANATGAVKDSWITATTKIALFADDRVSGTGINVDTTGGTVRLRGKVGTADEQRAAEDVAKGIDGVRSVRNDLQVVPAAERKVVESKDGDLKDAAERRIKQDTRLKGADIDVRVDRGVVTLTGDVQNLDTAARASQVAREVPGVRSVKNELREKS